MNDSVVGRSVGSKAWPRFHERLTETLASLAEDHFLILVRKQTNRFVQFAEQGAFGMRAEVVCNSFLKGTERLSTADTLLLGLLGWNGPTSGPGGSPEQDPDGSPNYFREWERPVDHSERAASAVQAMIQVLNVPHPGYLEYQAFNTEGERIVLPALGLKCSG